MHRMCESILADLALHPMEFPDSFTAIVALWFFFLGGAIGSFLNVVVYRLPLGLSIVRPGSHCPRCKTPILPRDNVPVFGWLLLRGKCRACGCRISPRYPLVEAAAGLTFVLFMILEPLADGVNLPIAQGPTAQANYPLLGIAVYHFALAMTLGGAALMAVDGAAIPRRYWLVMLAAGFLPPIAWPQLRPVAALLGGDGSTPFAGAADGLIGVAVGWLIGLCASPAELERRPSDRAPFDAAFAGACLGAYLGWQAACGILFVSVLAWAVGRLGSRFLETPAVGPLALIALTTTAWICAWRPLVDFVRRGETPLVGAGAPWYIAAVVGGLVAVLAASGKGLVRRDVV